MHRNKIQTLLYFFDFPQILSSYTEKYDFKKFQKLSKTKFAFPIDIFVEN